MIRLSITVLVVAVVFVATMVRRRNPSVLPEVLATVTDDATLPSVELNGRTFHAEAHGDLGAPVAVVLHGGPGGDYRSLLPLSELADEYRVVFYDQRGAGLSERVPDEELTPQTALADLDALIDLHSPRRPIALIGHSWGATLAAGYLGHRPERVRAAVLAEPGYLDDAEFARWKRRYDSLMSGWRYWRLAIGAGFRARRVDGPDDHASDDFLVGQCILPAFTNHVDNPYHRPGQPYTASMWRWGRAAGDALAGETFGEAGRVGGFVGPVLFLAGSCNTWTGESLQSLHTARFSTARLAVIDDAGHDMFADNPTVAVRAVRQFLDDTYAPRSRWHDERSCPTRDVGTIAAGVPTTMLPEMCGERPDFVPARVPVGRASGNVVPGVWAPTGWCPPGQR